MDIQTATVILALDGHPAAEERYRAMTVPTVVRIITELYPRGDLFFSGATDHPYPSKDAAFRALAVWQSR